MLAFVVRRLLQALLVMLSVAFIAFMLFQYVGDPVTNILGQDATPEQRQQMRSDLGLDRPFPIQVAHFVQHAAQGEFGLSLRQGRKGLFADRRAPAGDPRTVVHRGPDRLGDRHSDGRLFRAAAWHASVADTDDAVVDRRVAADFLDRHPADLAVRGHAEVAAELWARRGRHPRRLDHGLFVGRRLEAFDPARHHACRLSTDADHAFGALEMLEVLRADYIKFARARGLPNRAVYFSHALKNTLVPVITITGLQLGSLIAFAIITETVFQWPGMGLLFIQAVTFADIPVMAAYLCLIALIFVVINLVVDLLYFVVDPRLRVERPTGGH
jgi:peptide/nickel transport system permease protein